MSNNISFVYKNGFKFFSLLLVVLVTTGFTKSDHLDYKNKKKRQRIVKTAKKHLGTKYRAGGKSPRGFDCSGFTYYIFNKYDIKLGASSRDQSKQGMKVKVKKLKPGDLVFFGSKRHINHVGLVTKTKNNELWMIHSSSSRGIIEEEIYGSDYWRKRLRFGRRVI